MRIHVLLGGALMLALAASARADDKTAIKAQYPKGAEYKTETQVIIRSQMPGIGGDSLPGGPAAPVAASATAHMGSLIVIKATATYKVEAVDTKGGARIVRPTLTPVAVKEIPAQLGAAPADTTAGIDPVLRLKITEDGQADVLGLKEAEEAIKKASAESSVVPAAVQAQRLLARFAMATFWMPKKPVAVGDSWPVTLAFPLPEGAPNVAPLTGQCKLVGRGDGVIRLEFSGGLTGTAQVAEHSGWMTACELAFRPTGGGGGPAQVTGQIIQKTVK